MRATTAAEVAVGELYRATYGRLVGVLAVAAGSRDEAEEVVQEAFVRLLRAWPNVSKYDDPEAWLRQVAFRQLSNRLRKARNGVTAAMRIGPSPQEASPSGDRVDVARVLQGVPLSQRQVLVLYYLLDMSVADIAVVLGIAPGTVKSRLSRGRSDIHRLEDRENGYA